MKQPKILITGGSGFAGSHLIEELIQQGYQDVYSTTFSSVAQKDLLLDPTRYVQVDLTNQEETHKVIAQLCPDWIFHLASFAYVGKSFQKAASLLSNNILLTLSVLEAVRVGAPQARVLTIGSAEEYGFVDATIEKINEDVVLNPVNPYAVSKVAQDLLAGSYFLSHRLSIIRARPFNHIGIRQTDDFMLPSFAKQVVAIERGQQKMLLVGNLEAVRDFTSVKDMVRAYILLMQKGEIGQVYNIGSGTGIQIQSIVDTLLSLAQVPVVLHVDPDRFRPLDAPGLIADNRKICALGWKPTVPVSDELRNVLEQYRAMTKG